MTAGYILLFASVTVFGAAALAAFYWALRTGQMDNLDRSATTIFGPDEPIGQMTDTTLGVPDERWE